MERLTRTPESAFQEDYTEWQKRAIIKKLKKVEDIMEKYGVEDLEDLEHKIQCISAIRNNIRETVVQTNVPFENSIGGRINGQINLEYQKQFSRAERKALLDFLEKELGYNKKYKDASKNIGGFDPYLTLEILNTGITDLKTKKLCAYGQNLSLYSTMIDESEGDIFHVRTRYGLFDNSTNDIYWFDEYGKKWEVRSGVHKYS